MVDHESFVFNHLFEAVSPKLWLFPTKSVHRTVDHPIGPTISSVLAGTKCLVVVIKTKKERKKEEIGRHNIITGFPRKDRDIRWYIV